MEQSHVWLAEQEHLPVTAATRKKKKKSQQECQECTERAISFFFFLIKFIYLDNQLLNMGSSNESLISYCSCHIVDIETHILLKES